VLRKKADILTESVVFAILLMFFANVRYIIYKYMIYRYIQYFEQDIKRTLIGQKRTKADILKMYVIDYVNMTHFNMTHKRYLGKGVHTLKIK